MRQSFKILSVFLAVLIVSVGFLQPIAYANAVVAGGALVLLVAALLVSVGLTFTSQQQLESTAKYAISNMPGALRQELDNVIEVNFPDHSGGGSGGSDPDPKKPFNVPSIHKGILQVCMLSAYAYEMFKTWVYNDLVKKDESSYEAVVSDSLVAVTDLNGNSISVPISPLGAHNGDPTINDGRIFYDWFDFVGFNGNTNRMIVVEHLAETSDLKAGFTFYISINGGSGTIRTTTYDYGVQVIAYSDGVSLDLRYCYQSRSKTKPTYSGTYPLRAGNFARQSLPIDPPGYYYSPAGQDEIPIAISSELSDMLDQRFQDVINEYGIDNWDWSKTLEEMKQELEALKNSVNNIGAEDLDNSINALQSEIERLSGLLSEQGLEPVGGAEAMNEALLDAALVINSLKEAAKQNEAAHEAQIKEFEQALEAAKKAIEELTDSITNPGEVPVTPPVVVGNIDFSPLSSFKDFMRVFPFCIPFDIIDMFKSLKTTPQAPVFEIPFEIPGVFKEKIIVDLSVVNPVMPFVRLFILIGFSVGVARLSSSLIKW